MTKRGSGCGCGTLFLGCVLLYIALTVTGGVLAWMDSHPLGLLLLVSTTLLALVGVAVLAIMRGTVVAMGALWSGSRTALASRSASAQMKLCPYCAELVHPRAMVCRHCQRELPVFGALEHPAYE